MNNIKKLEDFLDRMQGLFDEAKKHGHIVLSVDDLENAFPELKANEDERIRKRIIQALHGDILDMEEINKALAWLEKKVLIDEEKVLIGVRKDVALSIMDFLDRNTLGMCLSNMECEDIENAVIDSDWSKVYNYMKKKLEKQVEQTTVDEVDIFEKDYKGLTDFERTLVDACIGWIGRELGWKAYIKDNANELLKIAIKKFNSVQDVPFEQNLVGDEEDEKIRKNLITFLKDEYGTNSCAYFAGIKVKEIVGWLEKQGGITKLSEEEQNRFSKGVLTSCALSFINYLDAHKYEGKMCVSNGECEDIENAFHNAMWDRLHRYYCKYIEKQGKQNFEMKSAEESLGISIEKYNDIVNECLYDESNSTDKAKPKFKVGDWLIRSAEGFKHNTYLVTEVKDYYVCEELNGRQVTFTFNDVHQNFKLWDISDAKDGDVLISRNNNPFIYNGERNSSHIGSYCGIIMTGKRFDVSTEKCSWTENVDIHPATKEQRDFLFQKMKVAGFEWDTENKKLNKIEPKFKVGDWVVLTEGDLSTTLQIVNVDTNKKVYWFNDSSYLYFADEDCLQHWTIQDAKDGDVLTSGEVIFIFNMIHDGWINCHCYFHKDGSFINEDYDLMTIEYGKEVYPATKEQRDTLFKAIADEGYEFDFDKKELKKVN